MAGVSQDVITTDCLFRSGRCWRFNGRSRDPISAARNLLHGRTTGSLSPGLAGARIAAIGGRQRFRLES